MPLSVCLPATTACPEMQAGKRPPHHLASPRAACSSRSIGEVSAKQDTPPTASSSAPRHLCQATQTHATWHR